MLKKTSRGAWKCSFPTFQEIMTDRRTNRSTNRQTRRILCVRVFTYTYIYVYRISNSGQKWYQLEGGGGGWGKVVEAVSQLNLVFIFSHNITQYIYELYLSLGGGSSSIIYHNLYIHTEANLNHEKNSFSKELRSIRVISNIRTKAKTDGWTNKLI